MKILDLLRMSAGSLWKRKVRTVLTVLGVVVGTASIVVMISLGLGLNKSSMDMIEKNGGLTTITVTESYGNEAGFSGGAVISMATNADSSSEKKKRLDDAAVEAIRKLPHVQVVSPVLSCYVIAKYGSYEANLNLQGMSLEALQKMNIELKAGHLPQENAGKLELVYGNMVLADFSNRKTGENYWSTGKIPEIDLMNDSIFVIFDTDAYYQSQNGQNQEKGKAPVVPPKKYVLEASGLVAGEIDEYTSNGWNVYCDIEQLKLQLKKAFKNKAIPGQPTRTSGKPYKELFYNSIYVNVDDVNAMPDIQKAIMEMGYQANSNSEWAESTKEQFGYIQLVIGVY